MRGRHLGKLNGLPPTRRRITTRVACVFEVRNGQLAHERLYWDRVCRTKIEMSAFSQSKNVLFSS
jgi:hypothetical protein